MIASKLILIFCLYFLLLLDNSLGQKLLITEDGNKALFQRAVKFGQTYGGELGELGSQWKQLLIQLVYAKRNVGLGKVQLARFNDSAMTEEVGLVIPDSYADKVAELVAIRTQDIGTTQKYINELEILKNEIALTMIVEMDEIEAQFKEKNVREKVKEAKENGLTDEDIKELLFAQFIESEGLSLIGAGASVAEALLSSFLNGMKSILYKTYFEKPGIIQYGNVIGCLPFGNCVGEGGDYGGNNNGARGGGDDPGGDQPPGGGGGNLGGAAGGGEPPGGGGGGDRPPPNARIYDVDDQEETDDPRINDDIDAFFEEFMASLPEERRELSPEDQLETWLFNLDGDGLGVEQAAGFNGAGGAEESNDDSGFFGTPSFTRTEILVANERVRVGMHRRRAQVMAFENELRTLQDRRSINYFNNEEYREPNYRNLSRSERAFVLNLRISVFEDLLRRARQLHSDLLEYRIIFQRNYYRARDNVYYYAPRVGWNLAAVPRHLITFRTPPPRLAEFQHRDESDHLRYVISRAYLVRMLSIGERIQFAFNSLRPEIDQLERTLENETALLRVYNVERTH